MTFGEYFRKLLKERNTNLSKLAVKASIKSKNEIYRIFDNKYSYNKTKKLTEQILSVIDIEEEEKNTLYKLMECCKIKNSTRKAWGILEGLYKGSIPFICCYTKQRQKSSRMTNILNTWRN